MKLFFILLLSICAYAQETRVYATGQYSMPIEQWNTTHDLELLKKQSHLLAKQNAIEQAGVTIYSSIESTVNTSRKRDQREKIKKRVISRVEAVAAGILKIIIISEEKTEDERFVYYTTKIEASVEVANAEELFAKADKRINKINKLQTQNKHIAKKLQDISKKLAYILAKGTPYELKEPQAILKKQAKLLRTYEKNSKAIKVSFKKGTLLKMLEVNSIFDEAEFEDAKRQFDASFTKPFYENFHIKISNVTLRKWRGIPLMEFDLDYGLKKSLYSSMYSSKYFNGHHVPKLSRFYRLKYMNYAVKDSNIARDLYAWIEKERNIVIKVTIGNKVYYTERVARAVGMTMPLYGSIVEWSSREKEYFEWINHDKVLTHRAILGIPISTLRDAKNIKAELVMVSSAKFYHERAEYVDYFTLRDYKEKKLKSSEMRELSTAFQMRFGKRKKSDNLDIYENSSDNIKALPLRAERHK